MGLGPYEILSPWEADGRGLSRPRSANGRDVAIKVSAERFSDRFEREVRAVAALNHPIRVPIRTGRASSVALAARKARAGPTTAE